MEEQHIGISQESLKGEVTAQAGSVKRPDEPANHSKSKRTISANNAQ
jgi:hypothetical protein